MARSRGPVYIADNSVTAINDALQQLLFMLDEVKGEHDNTTVIVGPHTHTGGPQTGGPIVIPPGTIDHDDLLNVTEDQHHAKLHETSHREGGLDELKLDDAGTPEDNTDNDATTFHHGLLPKLSGNATDALHGDGTFGPVTAVDATDVANVEGSAQEQIWEQVLAGTNITITELASGNAIKIDASGGGGTGPNIWNPDNPPASAGSEDDEFADNSGGVPGGWTEWDFGATMAPVEDSRGLLLTQTGGSNLGGIYKAIPAGNFTMWTKVYMPDFINQCYVGLALLEDGASSTGDVVSWGYDSSGNARAIYTWSAYNSFSGTTSSTGFTDLMKKLYIRLRRTGTTYAYDYSYDGWLWNQYFSGTIGFTPQHIALFCYSVTATQASIFPFFRYVASDVGVAGVAEGKRF